MLKSEARTAALAALAVGLLLALTSLGSGGVSGPGLDLGVAKDGDATTTTTTTAVAKEATATTSTAGDAYPKVVNNPSGLPHLLVDVPVAEDALERTIFTYELLNAYGFAWGRKVAQFTNLHPTFTLKPYGKPVKVVLLDWNEVTFPDGRRVLRYNPPNSAYEYFPLDELEKLRRALEQDVEAAVERLWARLQPEKIEAQIVENLAAQLGVPEERVREDLDEVVDVGSGYKATVRQILHIPKFAKADFLPDVLIVGALPAGVLGATTVGLEGGKRVALYSPLAWKWDRLMGEPYVLQHEFVHANSQIQGLPLAYYFDVEMFAELSVLLADIYPFEFFFHGYLEAVRRAAWAFFRFDARAAANQLFDLSVAGVLSLDEQKFWDFQDKVQQIAQELKRFVREVLYPTFYSNPLWWVALNTKLCQSYAFFDLLMAVSYELTVLDGAENTQRWILENEDVIRKVAERALERAGERKERPEDLDKELEGFSSCPQGWVPWPAYVFPPGRTSALVQDLQAREWVEKLLEFVGAMN